MLAAISLNPKIYLAVIFIGMAICIAIILLTPSKKKSEPADEADASPDTDSDPNELTATPAVVVSKRYDEYYRGEKSSRHRVGYFVTFLVDGEEREVLVDRATFERVYEGEASTLVMEGKNFFDFSDGEDAVDVENTEFDDTEDIDTEYTTGDSDAE